MYKYFEKLLKKHGVTAYRVSKETGVTTATLTSWKQGKYTPKPEKLQKIADYFGVPVDYFITGNDTDQILYTCPDCGLSYVPTEFEDAKFHVENHIKWEKATKKFGELYCVHAINEKIKAENRGISHDLTRSLEVRYNAQLEVLRCLFSRSIISSGFDLRHVAFEKYVAMMLNTKKYCALLDKELYKELIDKYGTLPGIHDGESIYYIPQETPKQTTLAAHKDSENFTPEELEKIEEYKKLLIAARPKE